MRIKSYITLMGVTLLGELWLSSQLAVFAQGGLGPAASDPTVDPLIQITVPAPSNVSTTGGTPFAPIAPAAMTTQVLQQPIVNYIDHQIFSGSLPEDGLFLPEDEVKVCKKKGRNTIVKGKVLMDTGKTAMKVNTTIGEVTVGPGSVAQITVDPDKGVRITDLEGPKDNIVLTSESGETQKLSSGEDFFVQTDSQDLFIPVDGQKTSQPPISGKVVFAGHPSTKSSIPANTYASYVPRYITIAGRSMQLGAHGKAKGPYSNKTLAARRKPVRQLAVNGTPQAAWTTEGTDLISGIKELKLNSGSLLVHLPETTSIKTPLAEAVADKGTVLDVEAQEGLVRIKIAAGVHHVYITTGKKQIKLRIGQEVLITDHVPEKEERNPADGIGRRHLGSVLADDHKTITLCAFDPVAHLCSSPYVRSLQTSNSKQDVQLLDKMIKAAAVVNYLSSNKRYYTATN